MKYQRENHCKECHQWFYYFSEYPNGRTREYCDSCRVSKQRDLATERKIRQRQREHARKNVHPTRRGMGGGEDARRGGEGPVTPPSKWAGVGMFADRSREDASRWRRRFGLPV